MKKVRKPRPTMFGTVFLDSTPDFLRRWEIAAMREWLKRYDEWLVYQKIEGVER